MTAMKSESKSLEVITWAMLASGHSVLEKEHQKLRKDVTVMPYHLI